MASRKFGAGSYRAFADSQSMRWDLVRRAGAKQRVAPCVALSRQPGAGGDALGQLLAEKLDYGFFGREIVETVAAELGVDHWVLQGLDETGRSGIQRFVADLFRIRPISDDALLRKVTLAVATIGRRGGAILVGRGAPFILPAESALRILVVAPRELRVERYAKAKGVSSDDAARDIAFAEQQRAAFVECNFHVQQNDPLLYDYVVNTGTTSVEDAAEVMLEAFRRRFPA